MDDVAYNGIAYTDLLMMAVALHGLSAEAMQKRGRHLTACGRPILRQTLYWADLWNAKTRTALYQDMNDPVVDALYETLIGLSRKPDPLINGFGKLGSEDQPPSYPTYTAFGLTERGRNHAADLFRRYPQFQSPAPIPD